MADPEETSRSFTTSIVRWALAVRLLSLLVVLVLPLDELRSPRVVVAVALVAAWSLLWLAPGGQPLRYLQRHPLVAMGDVLLAVAVTGLVGVDSPLIFATLSTALVVGVLFPPLAAWLVSAVLVLGYLLAALPETQGERELFLHTLVIPATFGVLAALGGVTRRLHARVLAEQALLARAEIQAARSAERARLARDMHDSVAKTLHGVALAAAALPRWIEQDATLAVRQAEEIRHAAEQGAVAARAMLGELRRAEPEDSFVQRLTRLVDSYRERAGLQVDLETRDLVELRPDTGEEVLKVVGEALENVARHASASQVCVDVRGEADGRIVVQVRDDGCGFDPAGVAVDRYGVVGMRERALAVGGDLEVASRPGDGTSVLLRVPIGALPGGSS